MTILATDNFTRANGSTLGATWTDVTAGWNIQDNEAENALGSGAMTFKNTVVWPNDQYAKVTLRTLLGTADEGPGPAVRMAAAARTAYFGQANTVDTRLYKVVADAFTQLGATVGPCASGDKLQVQAVGDQISLLKDTGGGFVTIIGPITDSAIASGNAGLWGANANFVTIDDWEGGDLGTAQEEEAHQGRRVLAVP